MDDMTETIYAVFDSTLGGYNIKGHYNYGIHPNLFDGNEEEHTPKTDGILKDAVKLTEEQWHLSVDKKIRINPKTKKVERLKEDKAEQKRMLEATIRSERNSLLAMKVDPVVSNPLRWGSMTPEQQQKHIDYRKSLLDITSQEGFPFDVVFPDPPE